MTLESAEPSVLPTTTGDRPAPITGVLSCESEPVHAPGAIQPHGGMLVALADGLLVTHASANLDQILSCPARLVLGRSLEEAIGKETCRLLLHDRALGSSSTTVRLGPRGGRLRFRAHDTGRYICVDIEQVPIRVPRILPVVTVEEVLKTFEPAATSDELCELAVNGLKAITGYERVMAYRFVEAGHGEVIAEAREPHLKAYLGLRYPASDIPPQARRLYMRQRVGAIADSAADPVPLLADPALDDGSPLDLTHSTLRSASPIHRAYMRNMNTAASLTVGLARGADLWGMLVCHHGTPRVAQADLRAAAGGIGMVVSLLLASLDEAAASAERLERGKILRTLIDAIGGSRLIPEALAAKGAHLLRLVDASGALLCSSGNHLFVGSTPEPAAAAAALATLQSLDCGDVLAIEDLSHGFPALAACTEHGSGALLLRLASGINDAVLWFRREEARTVTWGGNPTKHEAVDLVTNRLRPRASFEAWKETVRNRSSPWKEIDLALARELAMAVQVEAATRTKVDLRDTQARLGLLIEHSDVVVILTDLNGTYQYVSPSAKRVLGWTPEDLIGRSTVDFTHPEDHRTLLDTNNAKPGSGQSSESLRFRQPDGSWLWVERHARLRTSADGQAPEDYVVVLRDATERKSAELSMSHLNRVHAMLSNLNTLILRVRDRDRLFAEACDIAITSGRFRLAAIGSVDREAKAVVLVASAGENEELLAVARRLLLTRELDSPAMVTRAVTEKMTLVSNDSQNDPQVLLSKEFAAHGIRSMAFLPLIVADEAVGVLALYAGETQFFYEDEIKLLTQLAGDISFAIDHIAKGERIAFLAHHDVLTGLANRGRFLERLAEFKRAAVAGNHKLALFLIDLERFRALNDSLGRAAGDVVLKEVAGWLIVCAGSATMLARVGPNQFVVVLPIVRQFADMTQFLEKLLGAFNKYRFHFEGAEFQIVGRYGISVFPDDGTRAEVLFKNAEAALKSSKASGRRYQFYTPTMNDRVVERLALENQLRQALQNNEFVLHYQPKVDLKTGKVTGAEALLRWNDPRTGLVPPQRFISVLEETGLIHDVGRWALRQALADSMCWRAAGLTSVRVAVNISALQLRDPTYLGEITELVRSSSYASAGLELEITETTVMEDVPSTIASLIAIRDLGVTTAIDDFGTGFSSLSYLSRLPVDALKIDRSFVDGMTAGAAGLAIVSTILGLARALKLKVVAEGVETEEQSRLLRLLGCDEMQGFLFSEAVPAEIFASRFLSPAVGTSMMRG